MVAAALLLSSSVSREEILCLNFGPLFANNLLPSRHCFYLLRNRSIVGILISDFVLLDGEVYSRDEEANRKECKLHWLSSNTSCESEYQLADRAFSCSNDCVYQFVRTKSVEECDPLLVFSDP